MKKILSVVLAIILAVIYLFNVLLKQDIDDYTDYHFRSDDLLVEHYEKHGQYMGFDSIQDYEKAASDVINNTNSLHKKEKEDGDDIYYLVSTNEYVIVSKDGYIRTYFCPDNGKEYYDKK